MNRTLNLSIISKFSILMMLFLINGLTYAVNPVNGFYAGMIIGPSYAPDATFKLDTPFSSTAVPGTVHYSVLGNIGGQAGYRFNHFRVEGELFVNYNKFHTLNVGSITFNTPYAYYDTITMNGGTTTGALMLNGFYDFYTLGQTNYWSPYVGLGIGYSYIYNTIAFYNNSIPIAGASTSKSSTTPAGQFIIGLGYFLDDFTKIGLDYRYFTTEAVKPFDSRTSLSSLNITLIGSFDHG